MKKNILLLLAAMLLCSSLAIASDKEFQLESVTVTAEKTEEDSQKVSIPMNIFTEDQIQDQNITSLKELTMHVPGIFAIESYRQGEMLVTFRGFRPSEFTKTNPVLLNVDDVPVDSFMGFTSMFEDVERVEILRGSQGTLYGKNSVGGVINIITKQPTNQVKGKVSLTAEEHNTYKTLFNVSSPIRKDKLFISISGLYRKTDGWMEEKNPTADKHMDREETKILNTKLKFKAGRNTSIDFKHSLYKLDAGSSPTIFSEDIDYDVYTNTDNYDTFKTINTYLMKIAHEASFADIKSITTYRDIKSTYTAISTPWWSFYGYGYCNLTEDYFSQEVRISSKKDKKIKWITGVYYDTVDLKKDMGMRYSNGMKMLWPGSEDIETKAIFGEVTSPLFSDKLFLTLGLRHETMKKSIDIDYKHNMSGAMSSEKLGDSKTWNTTLAKVSLSYQASDNLRYYTTLSQGHAPAGLNHYATENEHISFDESFSTNYEAGVKSTLLNNRLRLNANVFYSDYKDLQTEETVTPGIVAITNASQAHAQGIEVDFQAKPFKRFEIYGSAGYLKTEYDKFEDKNGDFTGKEIVNSPKYSLSLGGKYRLDQGFFLMTEYQRLGKTHFSFDNDDKYAQKAYGLVNIKAGYESEKGIDFYVYAKNLTDEKYFTTIKEVRSTYKVGQPRTIGAELTYRF